MFVQNVLSRCINTIGHGGGTIKRRSTCALLLVLGMTMCIISSAEGTENQNTLDGNSKIGLDGNKNVLEVKAAHKHTKSSKKVRTASKKVKTSKYKKYKVRGTSKYKKYRYKRVKAASSYKRSYYSGSNAGWSSDPTLDSILKSGSRFGYRRGISTAAAMENAGAGDCWAMSEWLNSKLTSAGYQSRVIQYATSYSRNHRSVQVNQNGNWVKVPYRAYGYHYLFT